MKRRCKRDCDLLVFAAASRVCLLALDTSLGIQGLPCGRCRRRRCRCHK